MKKKLHYFIILCLFLCQFYGLSQCGIIQTIPICDIETIDSDGDTLPDGIVNLYTLTGTDLTDGTWSTSIATSFAFDATTGNLFTWELREASELTDTYSFNLNSTACGTDPARALNIIIGPYSGVALPPDASEINFYVCSNDILDLSTVLVSNITTPVAHLNGTWQFTPTSPTIGTLVGSVLSDDVDYQPGLPRVDQNIYELTYTVPGITPCAVSAQTTVKIAIVRQVSSGTAHETDICESDIINGVYDADLNLNDDMFLEDEDIEGFWINEAAPDTPTLSININDLYNDLTDNGNSPKFGCMTYDFIYRVEKRSVVCVDSESTVSFTIYEQLRSFSQGSFPELCPGKAEDPPVIINLYDLISFTDDFIYNDDIYTHWEFVSGPSDLGLITKLQPDPMNPIDLTCAEDGRISLGEPAPYYDADAPVNITEAAPGTYRFRYIVCPEINGCITGNPCTQLSTEVVLILHPKEYAGENTNGINLCNTDGDVNLRDLLTTNGVDTIVDTGVWTNDSGDTVENLFVFPDFDGDQQIFNFTYSTVSVNGCTDQSTLSFTIYKEVNAGTGSDVNICADDLSITLFDQLEGDPDTTGIWTGPFGYISTDHLGVFIADDPTFPILGPGTYTYTVSGNPGCTTEDQASITITITRPEQVGDDVNATFCKLDGRVNLFSLLDEDTVRTGTFEDTDGTNALTGDGIVEFETLTNDIYTFRYVVTNSLPCDESDLFVNIQIVDLPIPDVPNQEFCILDAAHLDDVVVDVLNYNWYDTLESVTPIIDNPLLFDNQTYYIAQVDADNCESERLAVSISILNLGEISTTGELCTLEFQDGISPNGDLQYDTFDLEIDDVFNIPEAFPDFELQIFNRYGSLVYKGTINTEEFRGESNTSVRLGDDLPTGTYFYIFTPNFQNNLPIQGSFYLSR